MQIKFNPQRRDDTLMERR